MAYENGQLEMVIDNQSGSDYYYGREYMLQKKDGEAWIDVEPEVEYGWPKISLMVKDTETATEVYDLTVFGELEAGSYKLVKNDLEAEFTLVDNRAKYCDDCAKRVHKKQNAEYMKKRYHSGQLATKKCL